MSSTDEVTADERALGAERQILLDVGTSGNRAVHHDVAATVDLVGDAREHGCRPRSVGERTAAVIGDDDAGGARLNAQFGFVRRHDALEKKRKRRVPSTVRRSWVRQSGPSWRERLGLHCQGRS